MFLDCETYDFKRVSDDSDGHLLLAVVSTVHHECVGKALNDRALCLSESLGGIFTSGVGEVDWRSDLDVIASRFVNLSISSTHAQSRNPHVNEISLISTSS